VREGISWLIDPTKALHLVVVSSGGLPLYSVQKNDFGVVVFVIGYAVALLVCGLRLENSTFTVSRLRCP
jgi:hypothetical protein